MAVLFAACLSTLVVNANTSAVSILLPAISEDTGMSLETLQWAVTGYSLVGAAVIVTSGALGDVFGRRLLFLIGIALVRRLVRLHRSFDQRRGGDHRPLHPGRVRRDDPRLRTQPHLGRVLGAEQTRAVALWGAASAIGAAVGPLVGGVLVELTSWQGLFWLDAGVALICVPVALMGIEESNDPTRSRSIDYLGTVLVAAILVPIIYGMTKATDWGWISVGVLGMFALSALAAVAFVQVEERVPAPLVDLALLRNVTLVGSTIAILIGAGTINALGYLLSIYFQNPQVLGMSPLEAGLATLPMTIGLVAVTPFVTRLAVSLGTRQTVSLGFIISGAGFVLLAFVQDSWEYALFVVPIVAVAVGMGLSNGPASAASTACVSPNQIGSASGISNMARYVGSAVFVAMAASVYTGVRNARIDDGIDSSEALASGLAWSCVILAITCGLGVGMGLIGRYRKSHARPIDSAAATAAHAHTVPIQSEESFSPTAA